MGMGGVGLWVGVLVLVGGFGAALGVWPMPDAPTAPEECSVDLYDRIFKPCLAQMKTPYALVEFFASWEPACKGYKPHFERVACLFNHPRAVHEDEVFVVKVDCAIESNKGLCERFNVQSYPTMYIGPPEILASGSFASRGKKGLDSVEGGDVATGDDLLQWINKRINKRYSLKDKRPGDESDEEVTENQPPTVTTWQWQMPGTLQDVEEATAHAFAHMMDEKRMQSSSRASFIQFINLVERHHPSQRCREGSLKVLHNIAHWWPLRQPPANALKEQQLCGPGLPRGFWEICDGEGRGYSCGLWLLLHSLTVQVEDFESSVAISAINAFVSDFYECDHCHDHFFNATARNSFDSMVTRKDVVLWLWRTHNKVTEVVAQEEFKVKGNSTRKSWPLEKECPACRDSSEDALGWDEDAVYFYLMDFYRPVLRSGNNNNLRSEVVTVEKPVGVPYWAAASIAIASCGFTFATLYMRSYSLKFKSFQRLFRWS
ncbi:hypothetical protein M758_11G137400 [Ceratodon purpureus]|nr:hypothetical protein M758_11G137400 [Ceratodon purpureus]